MVGPSKINGLNDHSSAKSVRVAFGAHIKPLEHDPESRTGEKHKLNSVEGLWWGRTGLLFLYGDMGGGAH